MISKPLEVKALHKYVIWIKFSDNTRGNIDLSHLAHKGIFKQWETNNLFNKVYIDKETLAIAWNKNIELCPNSLYLKLLNVTFEEWKNKSYSHASD